MRIVALIACVLLGGSTLAAPSASARPADHAAASSTAAAGCSTKTFTKKVKYKKKVKLTLSHTATACVQRGVGPRGTCVYLASSNLIAGAGAKAGKKVTTVKQWKPIDDEGQTYVDCDGRLPLLGHSQTYSGTYRLKVGKKKVRAKPALLVRIDAEASPAVRFEPIAGTWKFGR